MGLPSRKRIQITHMHVQITFRHSHAWLQVIYRASPPPPCISTYYTMRGYTHYPYGNHSVPRLVQLVYLQHLQPNNSCFMYGVLDKWFVYVCKGLWQVFHVCFLKDCMIFGCLMGTTPCHTMACCRAWAFSIGLSHSCMVWWVTVLLWLGTCINQSMPQPGQGYHLFCTVKGSGKTRFGLLRAVSISTLNVDTFRPLICPHSPSGEGENAQNRIIYSSQH